ncbi:MAG TPA: hypothetical protein VGM27_24365 [Acidobacteriaceae bacterium]
MLNRTNIIVSAVLLAGFATFLTAQDGKTAKKVTAADLPTSNLISKSGPSFRVSKVSKTPTIIIYGDQRFTDPENTAVAIP